MSANQDFKDLFKILNDEKVEYLICGAHAVIYYTEPRYTKDIDIWVNPSESNALKVWNALAKFGAPLQGITVSDFSKQDTIYQIGLEPNRIDILMGIGNVDFNVAWCNCIDSNYDGISIKILGKNDLITTKQAAGRKQDLIDLERLKEYK